MQEAGEGLSTSRTGFWAAKLHTPAGLLRMVSTGSACLQAAPVQRAAKSSQYKGVCWRKSGSRWQAQLMFQGKPQYLGLFTDEVDAAKAYDQAVVERRGTTAGTNFSETAAEGPSVPCGQRSPGSSQYKGVSWNQASSKWKAQLCVQGRNQFLGHFTDELDAAKAYDQAVVQLKGTTDGTNFPETAAEGPSVPKRVTSSRYRGVSWETTASKWRAQLFHKGTPHWLGSYTDEVAAAKAYDQAVVRLRGTTSGTNFLDL